MAFFSFGALRFGLGLAACLASRSGSTVLDAALYAAAAGASLSGVFLDKHFASDVIAGSLLGYFIGEKISRSSGSTTDGNRPAVALVVNRGIIALSLSYSY